MHFNFDKAELPTLNYHASALEPVLISEIVELHHSVHHREYVDGYNKFADLLSSAMSRGEERKIQKLTDMVHFNAGGHRAHKLYFENLAPVNNGGGILPDDKSQLSHAIIKSWGSYQNMIDNFNAVASHLIRGSGWCWLAMCPDTQDIGISYTEHHDNVEEEDKIPLLVVDVWEHAYYLQYKAMKTDYFKNIWKIINWRVVEERYMKALKV